MRQAFVEDGWSRGPGPEAAHRPQYRQLDGAQEARRVALACRTPPAGRVRWTLQLLADRLVELEVVEAIGREGVRTTLKKMTSSRGGRSRG